MTDRNRTWTWSGREGFLRDARNVATMLRLLVLVVASVLGVSAPLERPVAYWALTCAYALSVLAPMLLVRGPRLPARWGTAIFLFDVVAISGIIVLRGHDMQGLLVATFALMLLAAVLEGLGNALLNVVLVGGAFVGITQWGVPASELLTAGNLAQLAFFVVTGTLMGYAADQARTHSAARRYAERHRRRAQVALYSTSQDLRRSEEQLEQAQESLRANERLYTLGMFSAGVSHEIKNPVAVILAAVEAAREIASEAQAQGEMEPCHELNDALDACHLACAHLQRLVHDLGRMSRAGDATSGEADPVVALDTASRLLAKVAATGVSLLVDAQSTRTARADAGRVLQVVLNLGKNAVDALAASGGRVVLRSRDEPDGRVCLEVEDDGPGIAEEIREHMYEAFHTTKPAGKGTGLGLHLVHEIVTSHRGSVECVSQRGVGTRFRVVLPAAAANGEGADGAETTEAADRGRRRGRAQGAAADAAA